MARVTRSANNLVPRKKYTNDVTHGLNGLNDRSSNAPSDSGKDSDVSSVYHEKNGKGIPKPRGKPQASKKRKAPTELGGEKKGPTVKRRNTGALGAIERRPSPDLDLRDVFSGEVEWESEEFEIPEPPPERRRSESILEGSVFNEFQAWSARIRNAQEDGGAEEAPSDDSEGYDEGFQAAQSRLDQLQRADSQDAEALQAHNRSLGSRSQSKAPAGIWMFPRSPPKQTAQHAGDTTEQHVNEKSEAGEGLPDADWEIQEQMNTELVAQGKLQQQREEERQSSEPPPDENSSDNASVDLVKFIDDGNGPIKDVYDLSEDESQIGDRIFDVDSESTPRNVVNRQELDNNTPLRDGDMDLSNQNASTETPPRPKPPSPTMEAPPAPATPAVQNQNSQSLVYAVPEKGSATAEVKSQHLRFILKCMEGQGWTDQGTEWEARLLFGFNVRLSHSDRDEINAERSRWKLPPLDSIVGPHIMWYNAKRKRNSVEDERSRMLLYYMYKTWHTLRRAPRARITKNQGDYFTNGDGRALPKLIQLLQSRVDSACDKLLAEKDDMRKLEIARHMRTSLSRTLIPFLALILKEAFLLASISPQKRASLGDVAKLPSSSSLNDWHLHVVLTILGWMTGLTRTMISDYSRSPPRKLPVDWEQQEQQRRNALDQMESFEGVLQNVLEAKSHRAHKASQRAKAAKNARLIRAAKEAREARKAREKEDLERQDRQYQRFMKSMVKPSQSRDRAGSPTSPRFNLWKRAKKTPRKEEGRLSPKELYALDNKGWYWEEDCRILNAIRRVEAPNATNLAEDLPGRTAEEVSKRIPEVRDIARKHFARQGQRVPDWFWGGDV